MSDIVYPKPDKTYVRRGRCIYCGSKNIVNLYGYDWCGKPCKMGALGLDIYEQEHHLGKYAPSDTEDDAEEEK
jgi:hypothetical protein